MSGSNLISKRTVKLSLLLILVIDLAADAGRFGNSKGWQKEVLLKFQPTLGVK
jgi:hypothetical protein